MIKAMNTDMPISSIMTKKLVTVEPETTLARIKSLFEANAFHHLPVINTEKKLVGIISYTDYLRVIHDYFSQSGSPPAGEKLLHTLTVKDMMTENPVCLKPDDTVETALRVFRENPFHALPVTDDDHKLLGLLTTYDVMKVFEDVIAPEHSYSE